MRLICPNCGAQYEVDDNVIPEDGRDVQCSNCGHTWFEGPDARSFEMEDQTPADVPTPAQPHATPEPASQREPVQEAAPEPAPQPEPEPEPQPTPPPATTTPRPPLDSSIADILREEAAREEAARRADTDPILESQGDLGLTEPAPKAPTQPTPPSMTRGSRLTASMTQDRLDRLRGSPSNPVPVVAARSEMFPDIEEINSTLRSSAERDSMTPLDLEEEASNRRSGRRGFFGMLIVIAILVGIYAYADQIAQAVPALGDALATYVATVDQARLWLDEKVQSLLPATNNT